MTRGQNVYYNYLEPREHAVDMIEIVARAICKSRTCEGINCCQWPCNGGRWHDPRKQSTTCRVEEGRYDDAAREAIAAMQQPTAEMLEHAKPHMDSWSSNLEWWRKMIEQAGRRVPLTSPSETGAA